MNKLSKLISAFLFVCVLTAFANPLESMAADGAKNYEVSITPYAWLTSIDGTVGARGRRVDVDADFFSDIQEHINIAGMLSIEALFDNKFGLMTNFVYADLGEDKVAHGIRVNGDVTIFMTEVTPFYRVASVPLGQDQSILLNVDVLAGARTWSIDFDLAVDTPNMGSFRTSRSRSWVDPIVATRADFILNDRWNITLRGGLGGGINDTNSSWDASAIVGYKLWDNGALMLGYRSVSVNRREGSGESRFIFDTTVSGPMIGFRYTF